MVVVIKEEVEKVEGGRREDAGGDGGREEEQQPAAEKAGVEEARVEEEKKAPQRQRVKELVTTFDSDEGASPSSSDGLATEEPSPVGGLASALKTKEEVKFVIRSTDPIGQDTAVYEFSKYQMPVDPVKHAKKKNTVIDTVASVERTVARFLARTSVLLGRSSGRDKAAAVIQYGAMFWGAQPFVNVTGIRDGPEAPWKLLEDSMSNGRKVFRLGKWMKEYERARVALTAPDSFLGVVPSRTQALVTRFLAVMMNTFSFWYYVIDNMIWAAQSNLINHHPPEAELRDRLLEAYPKLSYEQYLKLQNKYEATAQGRKAAAARVSKWKDWKNWASLGRLVFAMTHSATQIRSLQGERKRLRERYAERIAKASGELPPCDDVSSTRLLRYDSVGSSVDKYCLRDPEEVREELRFRLKEVANAIYEQKRDVIGASANLGILLNRLKFPVFRNFPLWVIGVLGMVSGWAGCIKNWPTYVPEPKQPKVAKLRTNSIDEQAKSIRKAR